MAKDDQGLKTRYSLSATMTHSQGNADRWQQVGKWKSIKVYNTDTLKDKSIYGEKLLDKISACGSSP